MKQGVNLPDMRTIEAENGARTIGNCVKNPLWRWYMRLIVEMLARDKTRALAISKKSAYIPSQQRQDWLPPPDFHRKF